MNTEQTIEWLSDFGEVMVYSSKRKTWTANIELFVSTDGVDFKINSGCKHKTLSGAVSDLRSKFETVMNSMQPKEKGLINNA